MAINCDPAALEKAAACFQCISPDMREPVMIYLLAQIANGSAGTTTDPAALVKAATCYRCPEPATREAITNFLLCAIAKASGA